MTDFQLKEKAVALFIEALEEAGMQPASGLEVDKPKYYRGIVDDSEQMLYLNFTLTDNLSVLAGDDKTVVRGVYINGYLYSRNGSSDADYQFLANAIEESCKKKGFEFVFGSDGNTVPVDTESPIYYCGFEAQIKLIKENKNG